MEPVEIYDTLRNEVKQRTDGLDPSARGTTTKWAEGSKGLSGPDTFKVRVNHEGLAEDLDAYEHLLEQFSELGYAVKTATTLPYRGDHMHASRYWDSGGHDIYLNATDLNGITANDAVEVDDWAFANVEPIVEAEGPEEFRYMLRDHVDTAHQARRVINIDLDAVYDGLDAQDADGGAGDDAWYEELWDLVTDESLVRIDGEFYSIRDVFQERMDLNEEIAETAAALEDELDKSMREELEQYKPGLATRIARRIRR